MESSENEEDKSVFRLCLQMCLPFLDSKSRTKFSLVNKTIFNHHTSSFTQAFSYSRMNEVKDISDIVDDYSAYKGFQKARGFTYLSMGNAEATPERGWKLHISINIDQIDAAWSLILLSIQKHRIVLSKIVRREHIAHLNQNPQQRGKIITIYCFKQEKTPEGWMSFIQEVTKQLEEHHIRSGPIPGQELQLAPLDAGSESEFGHAQLIDSNYQDSSSDENSDNDIKEYAIPGNKYFTYRTDLFHDPNPNPLKKDGRFVIEEEIVIKCK